MRQRCSDESAFERLQGVEELAVKAARIHSFGPSRRRGGRGCADAVAGPKDVLVALMAAGVAPWDGDHPRGQEQG